MANIFDYVKFCAEEGANKGTFELPTRATRNATGIVPGELLWESSTKTLLLGNTSTVWDTVALSLSAGSGIAITGTNGRLTAAVNSTVVRTTGTNNISGVLRMLTGGTINASGSGAVIRLPQGTSFPAGIEGAIFWRTDLQLLYVYSATAVAWVPATVTALATDPALEYSASALRVQVDATTASGAIASVVDRSALGLGVRVDDATIKFTGAAGALQVGVIAEANMGATAKQSALEAKLVVGYTKVENVSAQASTCTLVVTDEVSGIALSTTPYLDLTTAEGIFVGISDTVYTKIRSATTKSAVAFQDAINATAVEVKGRLSSKGVMVDETPIPGVEVVAYGANGPSAFGVLEYAFADVSLTWDGGTPVQNIDTFTNPGYFKIQGSTADNYVLVKVDVGSLDNGADHTTNVVPITGTTNIPLSTITGTTIIGFDSVSGSSGGQLAFTLPGAVPTLAWDGGTGVDVSVDGIYVLESGTAGYIKVQVDSSSLPGAPTTENIDLANSTYYELQFVQGVEDAPFEFGSTTAIDFQFPEIFDLYAAPTDFGIDANFQAQFIESQYQVRAIAAPVAGYLPYYNANGLATVYPSTLFYNAGTNRYGFNTASPTHKVHVVGDSILKGNGAVATVLTVQNDVADFSNLLQFKNGAGTALATVDANGKVGIGVAPTVATLTVDNTLGLKKHVGAPSNIADVGQIYVESADSKAYFAPPTAGAVVQLLTKDAAGLLLASGALINVAKYAITSTPTGADQNTDITLTERMLPLWAFIDVTTAEVTGGTKTIKVGTVAHGNSSLINLTSVAATGLISPAVGSAGFGILIDSGAASRFNPVLPSSSSLITYTAASADWAEFRGTIYIYYLQIP